MNVTLIDIQSLSLDFPQAPRQLEGAIQEFPLLLQQNIPQPAPGDSQAVDFNELIAAGLMRPQGSAEADAAPPESRWQAYLAQAPIQVSSDLDQVSNITPRAELDPVPTGISTVLSSARLMPEPAGEGQPLPVDGKLLPPTGPAVMPQADLARLQLEPAATVPAGHGNAADIDTLVDEQSTRIVPPAVPAAPGAAAIAARATESPGGKAARDVAASALMPAEAMQPRPESRSLQQPTEPAPVKSDPTGPGNAPLPARPVPAERSRVLLASLAPVSPPRKERGLTDSLAPADLVRRLDGIASAVKGERSTATGISGELTALRQALQPREPVAAGLSARQNAPVATDARASVDPVTEGLRMTPPPARAATEVTGLDAGMQRVGDASQGLPANQPAVNTATVASPAPAAAASAPAVTSSLQPAAPLPPQLETLSLARSADSADWGNGIGERVSWMINQKLNTATIRLDPPSLGKLDVQVKLTDDATTITIQTQHAQSRELIESASLRLRDFLHDSGFQNVNVDVSQRQDQQQQRSQQLAENDAGERDGEFDQDQSSDHQQRDQESYFVSDGLLDTFA